MQLARRGVARQAARSVENGQRVIEISMHAHRELDEVAAMPLAWDLQCQAFERHAVVGPDAALELLAEDLLEVGAGRTQS
jgi:hypothetical protein